MIPNVNETQIDALKEATNIGAGHAAIALSQMLGKKIMIAVIRSNIVPSDVFLEEMVGDKEMLVAGVCLETLGDIKGAVVFMFDKNSSVKLSDMLLFRKPGRSKFIDEKAQSALKEVGSILTGAFFTVLADMLKLNVFHKTPSFVFDRAEVIILGVCEEVLGDCSKRLCLATEFIESSEKVSGVFAFIPTTDAMNSILEKLNAICKPGGKS